MHTNKRKVEVILKIAKAWADLFTYGPSTLSLTGSCVWITDDTSVFFALI